MLKKATMLAAAAANFLGFPLVFLSILLILTGCATTLPKDVQRTPSRAFANHETTSTGQLFDEKAQQHPGKSGFTIISKGRRAFTGRIAMTALAEKTIDLQYYIWEPDTTGRILALRLIEAADRGVRVRILLDDHTLESRDPGIASMDAHPNIEIRVFNPFAHRGSRLFGFLTDFDRINHRMHNKLVVVDNVLAIVGGRNIGDHYFGVEPDTNFRDLDVFSAGPIVREVSRVFDYFWNGDWSYPIAALVERTYTEADLSEAVATAREMINKEKYPYSLDEDVQKLIGQLGEIRGRLIWAPGRVVWDDPSSIAEGKEVDDIQEAIYRKLETLDEELLIESAYFVARERGIQMVKKLVEKGVRVRILTNSLASTDVVAAHGGYATGRKQLIENGAEIYELRPDAVSKTVTEKRYFAGGRSRAALHTKAIVFERDSVLIGSLNMDPRAGEINTEIVLYVKSEELARRVIAYMDEGVLLKNSYRVQLDDDGNLIWITEEDGQEVRYTMEPESTFWQRFVSGFVQMLGIEDQL
ncbi:MAG: phospholipase D family protein [Deltaproteobacteria bacterium]|jgi:putative cardiolipin synthase|nr:phospholipase D family protein [Deltaproteobacteria bacterium]